MINSQIYINDICIVFFLNYGIAYNAERVGKELSLCFSKSLNNDTIKY